MKQAFVNYEIIFSLVSLNKYKHNFSYWYITVTSEHSFLVIHLSQTNYAQGEYSQNVPQRVQVSQNVRVTENTCNKIQLVYFKTNCGWYNMIHAMHALWLTSLLILLHCTRQVHFHISQVDMQNSPFKRKRSYNVIMFKIITKHSWSLKALMRYPSMGIHESTSSTWCLFMPI